MDWVVAVRVVGLVKVVIAVTGGCIIVVGLGRTVIGVAFSPGPSPILSRSPILSLSRTLILSRSRILTAVSRPLAGVLGLRVLGRLATKVLVTCSFTLVGALVTAPSTLVSRATG